MLSQTVVKENPVSFAFKLFNGGLTKEQLSSIPGASAFMDSFEKYPHLKESVQYPATLSILFPGNSFGEVMKNDSIVRWANEKPTISREKLLAYYNEKISSPTISTEEKEKYTVAISEVTKMTNEQLNILLSGGLTGAGLNTQADAQSTEDYNKKWQEYAKKNAESLKKIEDSNILSITE